MYSGQGQPDRSRVLRAENIMFRPFANVREDDGPRVALRKMEEEGFSSIFVLGNELQAFFNL